MGFFDKLKSAFTKTATSLAHEIQRIVTRSPKLTAQSVEELEAALLAADLGLPMTQQILAAVRKAFETQGKSGLDFVDIAIAEVERSLGGMDATLKPRPDGVTVVGRAPTCSVRSDILPARCSPGFWAGAPWSRSPGHWPRRYFGGVCSPT